MSLTSSKRTRSVTELAVGKARLAAQRRRLRFRLAVLGTTVADVVESAGGWIVDRSMAGWDVTVATTDGGAHSEALRILGASGIDLVTALQMEGRGPVPHAVALSADLYFQEPRLVEGLHTSLKAGWPTITMWGEPWPNALGSDFQVVTHRLSACAVAFKGHALESVSLSASALRTESFRTVELGAGKRWPRDLVPSA